MNPGRTARTILAPNPGPMTLRGTNTWLLGDPEVGPLLVVDPGPDNPRHLDAILAVGPVQAILITHRHADHTEAAARLAERAGCPVRAVDPAFRIGSAGGLEEGIRIDGADVTVTVVETPGHTKDSVCLLVRAPDADARLLTGDTVLGRGTTVIAEPDGDLGDYLASLTRLQALVVEHAVAQLLPGHGPVVDDPAAVLDAYVRHRHERLDQVRAALEAGDTTAAEVVARVYADVDRAVWPAAEQSVRAQLRYLNHA